MNSRAARVLVALAVAAAIVAAAGACRKPRDPSTPAEMKEKISKGSGIIFWKVDATKEQEQRIDKLFDGVAPDFLALQEESKAITRRIMDALDAETVDPAELDRQRAATTALHDRYMKRLLEAGRDAAGIFTLPQRRKLVKLWREWEFGE